MTDYQLRPITEDEYPDFARLFERAFGRDHNETEAKLERELFDLPRTLGAFDERDGLVGTALSYARQMSVPGGSVPAAHVSGVAVYGTHRRRGIMTRLMRRLHAELRAGGTEPIAALWPSEEGIYGRFGYGPATTAVSYDADTGRLAIAPAPDEGRLRELDFGSSTELLAQAYEAVRPAFPGRSSRGPALWKIWQTDLEHWRGGASGMRLVVHENADGTTDGYALFRLSRGSDADGRLNIVRVEEVVTDDPTAYRELWRYLTSVDLTRRVRYSFAAVDEPLRYLVSDLSRLNPREQRGMWLRVLDLPAALCARSYVAPVDVVLDVTDELLPENAGRWRLSVDATGATCEPTTDTADVLLGIGAIGAAYLGGTSLAALGRAGQARETRRGALGALGTAFGWHRAPAGIEIF